MAGLGHKVWATDDILTAVDLNGYLADQAVMVFADAAARTAGITYPTEGMVAFMKDNNQLYSYDGSSWTKITSGTADSATRIIGKRIFIQSGTPTAENTDDIWFY